MKRKTIGFALVAAAAAVGLSACQGERFRVQGAIAGAEDSVLYFEQMGIEGSEVIDSVRLDAEGKFSFSAASPEAPEFYRLRIGRQIINIAIDSTETVGINAQYATMPTDYEVTGSDECQKIKELAVKQIALEQAALDIERDETLNREATLDSLYRLITRYKEEVKRDYIYKEPMKAYAYFALFQSIAGAPIFNPAADEEDTRVYGAVATSWDTFHPGALRGQNLHNIALEGMKNQRILKARREAISPDKVSETGLLDIKLTDNHGHERALSDLKGKVVMLDFHLFSMDESPTRILSLRELYNKFHNRGFEIYQVAIDPDEHFWKGKTEALPWICVRDADGLSSQRLSLYNVQALPEFFLIDRNNTLVKRSQQIEDVEAEISRLL